MRDCGLQCCAPKSTENDVADVDNNGEKVYCWMENEEKPSCKDHYDWLIRSVKLRVKQKLNFRVIAERLVTPQILLDFWSLLPRMSSASILHQHSSDAGVD
jgi:hypothetical protein